MVKTRLPILVLLLLGSIAVADEDRKSFVAFSLKSAGVRVQAALDRGEELRRGEPQLYFLGGVTKPWAVIVDAKHNDVILLGERDVRSASLTLDDLAVALRARFVHGERDPGVSIDPRCGQGEKERAMCLGATRQDVRYFGGVEGTHFGQVCYEADWLMKRIGLGMEPVAVPGLQTYYDLSVADARIRQVRSMKVGSRFWFYPIASRVNVIGDVVLLEKFQMGVFTEILNAEIDGKAVENLGSFEHGPSEGFSRSFSEHYDTLARDREVLDALRGLTRLAALAKGLTQMEHLPSLEFYLARYPVATVPTPSDVEVLRVQNGEVGFQVEGGVQLAALAMRFRKGEAGALRSVVLRTRPSADATAWTFEVETRDGQPVMVRTTGGTGLETLAGLYSQGQFLLAQKRYDEALEHFERIVQLKPDVPEGWLAKADALDKLERYNDAMAAVEQSLTVESRNARGWYGKGVILSHMGRSVEAIEAFDRAVAMNPHFAEAWSNRGLMLAYRARYDESLQSLDKAIAIAPRLAAPLGNKGMVLIKLRRLADALSAIDQALSLDPRDVHDLNNRGLALKELGRYDEALQSYDRALAIQPRLAAAWNNKASLLEKLGRADEALRCYAEAVKHAGGTGDQ